MRIILIRHAQATGNKERYIGWEDAELTDVGRRQAADLADALDGVEIHSVYCSPLSRAVATAAPLAHVRGIAPLVREALKEINFGDLQGTMKGARPFQLRKMYLERPMPGGESLRDVWARLLPVTREALDDVRIGQTVAIVAHYWTNRMLLGQLGDLPLESVFKETDYKPANASAFAIDFVTTGNSPCAPLAFARISRLFPADPPRSP